ncbi:MAG TPA: hypothetical protein VFR37_07060 [Longimicrobium sp.]|nr:hypothetical protein [Longimicrobium sp.]
MSIALRQGGFTTEPRNLFDVGAGLVVDYGPDGTPYFDVAMSGGGEATGHHHNDLYHPRAEALATFRLVADPLEFFELESNPFVWGDLDETSIALADGVVAIVAGNYNEAQAGDPPVAKGFTGNFGNFFHSSIYQLSVYETMTLNGQIDATAVPGDTIDEPPLGTGEINQDTGTPVLMLGSTATRVPYLIADMVDYYHAADLLDLAQHTGALPAAAIATGSYEIDKLGIKTELLYKAGSTERRGTSTSGYARKMLGQVSFAVSTQRYVVIPLTAAFTGTVRISVVNGSSSGSNILGRLTKDFSLNVTAAGVFAGGSLSSVWESWGLLTSNLMIGEWEYDAGGNTIRLPLVYVGTASRTLNVDMEILAGTSGMAILDDATVSDGVAIVNAYVREYRSVPDRLGIGKQPVQTLDVNGSVGINGTEVVTSGRVIQNATFGGSMKGAAIADADGSLADVTAKFNTLLAQRRTRGDQA